MQLRSQRVDNMMTLVTAVMGFGMFAFFTLVFVAAHG